MDRFAGFMGVAAQFDHGDGPSPRIAQMFR